MPETTINVVFIDTQEMFRDGVKKSFSKFPDIKIVFEAENEKKLMSQVGLDQIDVILIGVDKLSQEVQLGITKIRSIYSEARIIFMIDELMFNNHFYAVANLMKLGANSCISRAANIDEIYKAIDTVMYRDEYYFNELVKKSIYETTRSHKGIYTVEPDLTVKEIEVMKFTCEDRDTKEIGELMGLSPRTIGAMRGVIYTKTGTKSCAGIVMYAIRHGIYAMN